MNKLTAKKFIAILNEFGFNPVKLLRSITGLYKYIEDYKKFTIYSKRIRDRKIEIMGFPYPILSDYSKKAGTAKGHYFHQDLYVASKIFEKQPDQHLDIGSRVDGFIAHLLSFKQRVVLGDVRQLEYDNEHLSFLQIDLMKDNLNITGKSFNSISSLHVIEHLGLGRYGDGINPLGHKKALKNLKRLLNKGGYLYVSFPIASKSRVNFNAHRVLSVKDSIEMFSENELNVLEFSYVNDNGDLIKNCTIEEVQRCNIHYGCGIWTLTH